MAEACTYHNRVMAIQFAGRSAAICTSISINVHLPCIRRRAHKKKFHFQHTGFFCFRIALYKSLLVMGCGVSAFLCRSTQHCNLYAANL